MEEKQRRANVLEGCCAIKSGGSVKDAEEGEEEGESVRLRAQRWGRGFRGRGGGRLNLQDQGRCGGGHQGARQVGGGEWRDAGRRRRNGDRYRWAVRPIDLRQRLASVK